MGEKRRTEMEIIDDPDFNYEGYQVVRGEYFSHTYEPCLTFADRKVYVNTACIRKMEEYDYIQMLVNPDEKKVAVRPCTEDEKDSFRWCSATERRSPKQISCKIFFAKVIALMGWDPNDRYRLVGKLKDTRLGQIFVYDLTSPEVFKRNVREDGKVTSSKIPNYPEDWKNQFGIPVREHQGSNLVSIFNDAAVFTLEKDPKEIKRGNAEHSTESESGVEKNEGTIEETTESGNEGCGNAEESAGSDS